MSEVGLTSLDIAGAEGISDVGLIALIAQCHGLKDLNISGAWKITDVAIREYRQYRLQAREYHQWDEDIGWFLLESVILQTKNGSR